MAARCFQMVIEQAGQNYSAYVPDLPGCIATGRSREDVEQNIREAIQMRLLGLIEDWFLRDDVEWGLRGKD